MTDKEARWARVKHIRVRIMQEAYDLADRDDSEGYNSVKVMCSDVLAMINKLLDECQPEQEPVAWLSRDDARLALWEAINKREFGNPTDDKLILDHLHQQGLWIGKYTTPPRQWQGLTDEDVDEVERWVEFKEDGSGRIPTQKLVRYIERKLKEKNNAR